MNSTTQVLTHWSPTPRLPQSQNLRFALLWCNSTSNLHSSFYTYCPVEIWHEWYVEPVAKWRPALTGVAAAADAVRRNGDGDGVLVVGRSHVIRRCLDFMRWLGKGERESRGPFYFFQVPYWMKHRQNQTLSSMLPPLKKASLSFNFNTQGLWCHPSLWSLQSDFLCGIEMQVRWQLVWSRLCWWLSHYLGHGGKWVQGTIINANIQRMLSFCFPFK